MAKSGTVFQGFENKHCPFLHHLMVLPSLWIRHSLNFKENPLQAVGDKSVSFKLEKKISSSTL